ncbi:Long-chain-fatty-acid--CoA ligase [Patulibacter medicamentivorans]|uniref:Long-chain-fatty-acid--CoA ligase n=1 Tax=Patulibacter medicamentivorans TaxID=1097667 RepID=H0E9S3_9ACTN|nr:acyl-CoA synthetase [Patulibacter medicamentivorans]EHN09572.1 Long-chain-fatty-acid--CoA ligase [Patulibacter medicamentivorans]
MALPAPLEKVAASAGKTAFTLHQLTTAGVVGPMPPQKVPKILRALRGFGPTPAAGYTMNAVRRPDHTAIIDETGSLSFREVHERSNALAHELRRLGVKEGDSLAVMCRNHRGFVETIVAASKLGVHQLLLNTMFSGPQITDVLAREKPVVAVYDQEFHGLVAPGAAALKRVVWTHESAGEHTTGEPTAEQLIARGDRSDLTPPGERGRMVILTSGTTGTPKGAARQQPKSLNPAAQILSRMPLRSEERTMLAAPMFHSWGYLHFTMGFALGSTLVLQRRFTPEGTLAAIAEHRCQVLPVVPVMLQRILELPDEEIAKHDLSSLRIVALSGSALPGELAIRAMDRLGDVLYNLYGSTEVGWATIADPVDLRAAPGTAGRAPRGTAVRLYDDQARQITAPNAVGRIFVGNDMKFDGYTGGGGKDVIDGLLSSGDVGHFDEDGRLFVDGRDDDMIVSGGENVFPREVEDLIADLPQVKEVSVLGVPDAEWGARLRAFVVPVDGETVDADAIRAHVKANLASFKVPREVVVLDELPRNATGKVLKRELKELPA